MQASLSLPWLHTNSVRSIASTPVIPEAQCTVSSRFLYKSDPHLATRIPTCPYRWVGGRNPSLSIRSEWLMKSQQILAIKKFMSLTQSLAASSYSTLRISSHWCASMRRTTETKSLLFGHKQSEYHRMLLDKLELLLTSLLVKSKWMVLAQTLLCAISSQLLFLGICLPRIRLLSMPSIPLWERFPPTTSRRIATAS